MPETQKMHELYLEGCAGGKVSGVKEVLAFDTELIRLDTVCGKLVLKGKDLHVSQLSVDAGDIAFTGSVDSVQYMKKNRETEKNQSFWQRIFR